MRQITLTQFMNGYERGLITEVIVIKDKIYGRSIELKSLYIANDGEIVWSNLP